MTLWSDGTQTLRYAYIDGFAFVYLWERDRPTAAAYFHDVCSGMGLTQQGFVDALNSDSLRPGFRGLARDMREHRFDYLDKVDYFIRRLGLSEEDAIILAIHFTGMCPEAIALNLNRPPEEIRRAFDRIMAAYGDSGIAVDDGVFTDDPFQFYRRSRLYAGHHPDVSTFVHINLITIDLDGRYIQLSDQYVRRNNRDEGNGEGGYDPPDSGAEHSREEGRPQAGTSVHMPLLRRMLRPRGRRTHRTGDRIRLPMHPLRARLEEPRA